VLEEPLGEVPTPPTRFRWTPGEGEIGLSQVLLFRANLDLLWSSAPLPGGVHELEVPLTLYDGVPAGEKLYWRVREVHLGKPRATSALENFVFEIDSRGFRKGEADVLFDYVH
jgi:hypothetical protein